MGIPKEQVEEALARGFLNGGALRKEDRQKALELTPLLDEMVRALPRLTSVRPLKQPLVIVDACAGKSAAGILFLALADRGARARVLALDADAARVRHAHEGARALGVAERIDPRGADVADATAWPACPDLVVALHACGDASDVVIDRAVSCGARRVLLVPCCYGAAATRTHDGRAARVAAQGHADRWARTVGIPRHALVQRRFAQAVIDAERTLRLEAAGYQTEVVELMPPTVSPFCLLWRAKRVGEPTRSAAAALDHATIRSG
ncbi:MAG: hypothetical protein A2138_25735 [Deltaproteobacteria bacterium RBG_16_71_12]|nr:MAG: hypothetical protein A2138_25735 [Deltaproteobacteria bacterium RBG_16_71_12]